MNTNIAKTWLADGNTVIDMTRTCIERLDTVQWELLNASGYDVRRAGKYLLIEERAAAELKDMLTHGAQHHNSLFEEERIELGRKHRNYFIEKWAEVSRDCGIGLLEDVQRFGYWERNGIEPRITELVLALAGIGNLADDMAELMTLGALEDMARSLFDADAEITLEELKA